jgi:hypothetical protein
VRNRSRRDSLPELSESSVAALHNQPGNSEGQINEYNFDAVSLPAFGHLNRSALDDGNSTTSYVTATTDALTGIEQPAPSTGMAATYQGDVFQSLFSGVFGDARMPQDNDELEAQVVPVLDNTSGSGRSTRQSPEGFPFDFEMPMKKVPTPHMITPALPSLPSGDDYELHHYRKTYLIHTGLSTDFQTLVYLFYSVFCKQMPIVHPHTLLVANKPAVLLNAMRACGAVFIKTPNAAAYVNDVLTKSRNVILQELVNNFVSRSASRQLIVIFSLAACMIMHTLETS